MKMTLTRLPNGLTIFNLDGWMLRQPLSGFWTEVETAANLEMVRQAYDCLGIPFTVEVEGFDDLVRRVIREKVVEP